MRSSASATGGGTGGLAGRRLASLLLFTSVLAAARLAVADDYDAALTRAVAAKERALEVNEPTRWEQTLSLFQHANAIRSTRETYYEIGVAAAQLRRDDLAVEAYEAALALGIPGVPRAKAEAFVAEHASQMGRVELRGPAGADVSANGFWRGSLPLRRPLVVFSGPVVVRVTPPGQPPLEARLNLKRGTLEVVDLHPRERPVPVAPTEGAGSVSPLAASAPPRSPGSPPLALRSEPGPVADLSPSRGGDALGLGLALGGGAVTLASAILIPVSNGSINDSRAELEQSCEVRSGLDDCVHPNPGETARAQAAVNDIATWKAVRVGAWVGLGLGVAATVSGVVLLLQGTDRTASGGQDRWAAARPTRPARWGVMVLPGGAALVQRLTF